MVARVTSGRFVGRVEELAELRSAVREASSGQPCLVLLGGDSGLGKTRLVAELEHRLDEEIESAGERPLILRGEGVQAADGELPYAPLLGALRPLVRDRHEAIAGLSSATRAQLGAILPGLDADSRAPEPRDDPSGQLRLFEAILALLNALSERCPVLLVLEDMHWADRSTRTFVAFLARSLREERLMLLLTYRTDELSRRHPLRPLLSELERLGHARRIGLEPLGRAELAEALTDILGAAPDDRLLDRIYARGEGNPLYTEELLAAGLDGRGAAPESLRDAFLGRIERLSADPRRVARVVAVGRALDEPTLSAITGLDHEALHEALREAVSEQVLVPGASGRFCFRHALLREALYDDLLPGERGELHMALARHLEQARPPTGTVPACEDDELSRISAVASHYAAAGDQPAALRTTVEAAAAARRVQAWGEAADLFSRALELWPRVADPEAVCGVDHVELLRRAAVALSITDADVRAESMINQALSELDPERDPARHAALLARLARIQWSLNRGDEGVATGERALAALPEDDPLGDRPSLLAWLSRRAYLRGKHRQAAVEGEAALAAAVAAGDGEAEAEVLNTLGMVKTSLQRPEEGFAALRGAIELARAHEDVESVATARANLAEMLATAGRLPEGLQLARDGLAETPRAYVRSHDWLTLTVAELAFFAGDWGLARDSVAAVSANVAGNVLIFRQQTDAQIALGVGDEDRARATLEAITDAVAATAEPQWIGLHGTLCADLHTRRGELDAARAAVQGALDRLELCTDDVRQIACISAAGLAVEGDCAQRARDLHDDGELSDARQRAQLHLERLEAAAQEGGPLEAAWLTRGQAEMSRVRGRSAPDGWAAVAAAFDALDRPYPAAVARWRGAEGLVGSGDRAQAAGLVTETLTVARTLGSEWMTRELTRLAERGRLRLDGPRPDVDPEPAEEPFGLTDRERQVLALVTQGATNRQIGTALFMAEKTASVHVSRILAKLSVQSRTEAAAVAHRLHLT